MEEIITKKCTKCRIDKPLDDFCRDNRRTDGKRSDCRECERKQAATWRKKHPDDKAHQSRKWYLSKGKWKSWANAVKYKYGITLVEYESALKKQDSTCAICGKGQFKALHIDHDHESGKIRGLLCKQCNIGLGMFKDNTEVLASAIRYLINNKKE